MLKKARCLLVTTDTEREASFRTVIVRLNYPFEAEER